MRGWSGVRRRKGEEWSDYYAALFLCRRYSLVSCCYCNKSITKPGILNTTQVPLSSIWNVINLTSVFTVLAGLHSSWGLSKASCSTFVRSPCSLAPGLLCPCPVLGFPSQPFSQCPSSVSIPLSRGSVTARGSPGWIRKRDLFKN